MKVLVAYYSRGGTTKQMAHIIADAVRGAGVDTDCFSVTDDALGDLTAYDGIIVGSPTYYGTMAAEVKAFIDRSVSLHGRLDGKLGAAFSSAANLAGGNETTIISILQALLIHGMIIQGDPKGDHYGPVAIGAVDSRCELQCKRLAERFVKLLNAKSA